MFSRFPITFSRVPIWDTKVFCLGKMKKLFLAGLLWLLLLATNACVSTYVVKAKARPHLKIDPADNRPKPVEGDPKYYALLPLTIIADVATAPFQILYFSDSHSGHMWVDGWPVPLP